jgi:hypothetical protein
MRGTRLSIAAAMGVILYVALGLATLRRPSGWWLTTLFSIDAALLAFASMAALYRRGGRRAFCLGVAASGLTYLGLALGEETHRLLLTNRLLYEAVDWLPEDWDTRRWTSRWAGSEGLSFPLAGHLLLVGPVALVGGLVARYLHATQGDAP